MLAATMQRGHKQWPKKINLRQPKDNQTLTSTSPYAGKRENLRKAGNLEPSATVVVDYDNPTELRLRRERARVAEKWWNETKK